MFFLRNSTEAAIAVNHHDDLSPRRPTARLLAAAATWITALDTWAEKTRQRRHLAGLDDHMLDDIGLTRRQARRETSRWF